MYPTEVFPEPRQGTGSLAAEINFRMEMTMDQPDEARNLFRFRKRAEPGGLNSGLQSSFNTAIAAPMMSLVISSCFIR